MKVDERRAIADSYFAHNRVAGHHLHSFNQFLTKGIHQVIDQTSPVEVKLNDDHETAPILVELSEVQLSEPQISERDGTVRDLYPQEARLRNLTYASEVTINVEITKQEADGGIYKLDEGRQSLGRLPIMLQSQYCHLNGLSSEEKIKKGEDPADPGAYFIINGSERILIPSEDLISNHIITDVDTRYGDEIQLAKTFSRGQGYRAIAVCERNRDGLLRVSFPSVSGSINFITLVRALGLVTDEEIAYSVSKEPKILRFMLENLEESDVQTKKEALTALGEQVASSDDQDYLLSQANYVIDRYLLPHLKRQNKEQVEVRMDKAHYLCRMAKSCFELALNRIEPEDRDHYANKRVKVSGDLMLDLFRSVMNKVARDMKYHLEKLIRRNRSISVATVVNSDVLTKQLNRSIGTGNWVGRRSGVSEMLDRENYIATISHLRRIKSPLSRSQPHFDARGIHATQWGRLCPSETPEGPNCGLVQNFAQSVELTFEEVCQQDLVQQLEGFGLRT